MASIDIKGLTIRLPVIGADQRSFKRQITRTVGGTLGRMNFTPFVAALQNVNLQLKSGDRLGLVGHNGAGKTTLLRTIAGAYAPDEGFVEVEGRVAALLDLMAGIDTFATGLESIRMRGMVLGMSRKQIEERAEEIAEFSGLGPYLGMPIKSYSSGMLARLAFAITTAVDTEILLMDEWLGVGDQDFRDKAQKRLVELVDSAKIFVLASHDATLIRKMCNKFVVLQSGRASHIMTAEELDEFEAQPTSGEAVSDDGSTKPELSQAQPTGGEAVSDDGSTKPEPSQAQPTGWEAVSDDGSTKPEPSQAQPTGGEAVSDDGSTKPEPSQAQPTGREAVHPDHSAQPEGRDQDRVWVDEASYLARYPDVAKKVRAGHIGSGREHFLTAGRQEGLNPGPFGSALDADLTPRARAGASLSEHHRGVGYLSPEDLAVTDILPRRVAALGSCMLQQWGLDRSPQPGCELDFLLLNNAAGLPDLPIERIRSYDFQLIQLPLRGILLDDPFWRLTYDDVDGHIAIMEAAKDRLDAWLNTYMGWAREHGVLTFVANFLTPQKNPNGNLFPKYDLRNPQYLIDKLNEHLERTVRATPNAYVLDIDQIMASLGRRGLQDDTLLQLGHGALAEPTGLITNRLEPIEPLIEYYDLRERETFGACVWAELVSMFRTIRQADQVKLVVVDLDDTLWHGVSGDTADIGPHMIEHWPLGLIEALMFLKKRGVLLAICSRNEEARIRDIWPRIFGQQLSLDDFAAVAINWKPKSENMQTILEEVNLLPRSVVFIDDNPAERRAMHLAFPDMRILGRHPFYLRRILLWSAETQVASITAEGARRTEMVQAQVQREGERKVLSREEFLARAAPNVTLSRLPSTSHPRFARCLELINKTNQFNTTGERRTLQEMDSLLSAGAQVYSFEAADTFTNYGLVGVVIVQGNEITQWVMSCRVLGYDVEKAILVHLSEQIRRSVGSEPTARLIKTDLNFPCQDLYSNAGYVQSGDGLWRLPADRAIASPAHVKLQLQEE